MASSVSLMLSPPEVFLSFTKAGVRKAAMRWDMILLQSLMSGYYVGIGGIVSLALGGGIKPSFRADYPSVTKLALGILFPTGLIAIMATGGELFTGNNMVMMCAWLERKITILDLLKNWLLVFIGNGCGIVFTAFFWGWLPGTFNSAGNITIMFIRGIAEKKVRMNWGIVVIKAIGCNTMVCLACWLAVAANDGASKMIMLWPPILLFVIAGFEHSVANMFFIPIGMMLGADVNAFQFIFLNLIPVTIGNIIGGGILIATTYWYEFHPREVTPLGHKAPESIIAAAMSEHYAKSATSLLDDPEGIERVASQLLIAGVAQQLGRHHSQEIKGLPPGNTPPKHVKEVREEIQKGTFLKSGLMSKFSKNKECVTEGTVVSPATVASPTETQAHDPHSAV